MQRADGWAAFRMNMYSRSNAGRTSSKTIALHDNSVYGNYWNATSDRPGVLGAAKPDQPPERWCYYKSIESWLTRSSAVSSEGMRCRMS
jgi:hypothetical protein